MTYTSSANSKHVPMRVRHGMAYYSSADGGRMAFNASTDYIALTGTTEQNLAAFRNPADSGRDLILYYGEFGSTQDTRFRRYRGSTLTVPDANAKRPTVNSGGGTGTTVAELFLPAAFSASGGTVGKTAFIQAYAQYNANIDGATRLRPGQAIRWTITGGAQNGHEASIYLEWADVPAAA